MTLVPRPLQALTRSDALPGGLLLFGTALLFIPAEIFQGNQPFFAVSFLDLLNVLLPAAVGLAVLATLPALGADRPRKRRYAAALTGIAVAAWTNATFFSGTSGLLDGQTFTLVRDARALWVNGAVFLGIAAAVYVLMTRFTRHTRAFVLLLVALLSLQTAFIAVTARQASVVTPQRDQLASFSKESNVLLVLLDTFQSDLFDEILTMDPAVEPHFTGFTYFRDAASVSPTTYLAMPSIHSGEVLVPGQGLRPFYERAVVRGSFLNTLAAKGFDSLLVNVTIGACPEKTTCEDAGRIALGLRSSMLRSAAELADLSLLRMAPHAMKPLVFRRGEWLLSSLSFLRVLNAEVSNMVLDAMAAGMETDAKGPTVKMLHLMSSHPPARLSAECAYVGKTQWERSTAIAQNRCALRHLFPVFEGLKRHGIYDKTTILVFADHGSKLPPPGMSELAVRSNPLLLVKPAGATGPLRRSTALASLADIPATVCALSQACTWPLGSNVLTLPPGGARDRYYLSYRWHARYGGLNVFPLDGRFRLRGKPADIDGWERLPPTDTAPVHALTFDSQDPTDLFGPGWREPAKSPRWTTGAGAVMWLNPVPGGSGRVTATVSTHAANDNQMMEIAAGDQKVFRAVVKAGDPQQIEFQVPKGMLSQKQIRLRFWFSQWNPSPVRKGLTNVSVAFHRMEIR